MKYKNTIENVLKQVYNHEISVIEAMRIMSELDMDDTPINYPNSYPISYPIQLPAYQYDDHYDPTKIYCSMVTTTLDM